MKFEVPSFTNYKNMIGTKFNSGSRVTVDYSKGSQQQEQVFSKFQDICSLKRLDA